MKMTYWIGRGPTFFTLGLPRRGPSRRLDERES